MNPALKAFSPLLLLVAAFGSSMASAEPPTHAPAHGERGQHRYVYYPQKQVYYAPEQQLWFWRDGEAWSTGAALPLIYQQYTRDGYSVYLDSEKPYEEQDRVTKGYRKHEWAPYHYGTNDERAAPGKGYGAPMKSK